MQVETAALVCTDIWILRSCSYSRRQIRAAEEYQALIRQLQEMWLFGQLNTVGESKVQQQTDENAKVVADLLRQVLERQQPSSQDGVGGAEESMADGPVSNES